MSYGYYLVQLTYTANAWGALAAWAKAAKRTPAHRLGPVEKLIAELGGRFCDIDCKSPSGLAIEGKLVGCNVHDLVAITWFPSHQSALAFKIAVATEPGVSSIQLTPLMPMADAIEAMAMAAGARQTSGYSAPGSTVTTWKDPPPPNGKAAKAKPAR